MRPALQALLALLLAACGARPPPPPAVPPPAPQVAPVTMKKAPVADNATHAQELPAVGGWLDEDARKQAVADMLGRAAAAFDIGDHDGAARQAQAALYADPASLDAATVLARAHVALGNLAKAEAVARGAVAMPLGDLRAPLWMILGLAAEQDDRVDEAVVAYEKATTLDRDYYAAWTNLGALYLRQESYALAVDAFESALRLRPDAPAAHCNLGSALRARTADFVTEPQRVAVLLERALEQYLEAHRIDPRYAPAVFDLALLHLDGDASPKLSRREQLEFAVQFFEKYQDLVKQQRRGARPPPAAPVDEYLALARALLAKTR